MSWLIDELSNDNERLRAENFELSIKLNRVIREYSETITESHDKSEEIKRLSDLLDRHYFFLGLEKDTTTGIVSKLKSMFPGFRQKIKLIWSILK